MFTDYPDRLYARNTLMEIREHRLTPFIYCYSPATHGWGAKINVEPACNDQSGKKVYFKGFHCFKDPQVTLRHVFLGSTIGVSWGLPVDP